MAEIEKLIPHIIKWETSVTGQGLSNEQLFEKARQKGYANQKYDRGGATMVGVTIATFTAYRKKKGFKTTTVDDLKKMDFKTWRDLLKTMFWDKWKAGRFANTIEELNTQGRYDAVVDFCFNLGVDRFKRSTLYKHIIHHAPDKMVQEEFRRWVYATDSRTGKKVKLPGLVKRREWEAQRWMG